MWSESQLTVTVLPTYQVCPVCHVVSPCSTLGFLSHSTLGTDSEITIIIHRNIVIIYYNILKPYAILKRTGDMLLSCGLYYLIYGECTIESLNHACLLPVSQSGVRVFHPKLVQVIGRVWELWPGK